jgi:hypothetical protein
MATKGAGGRREPKVKLFEVRFVQIEAFLDVPQKWWAAVDDRSGTQTCPSLPPVPIDVRPDEMLGLSGVMVRRSSGFVDSNSKWYPPEAVVSPMCFIGVRDATGGAGADSVRRTFVRERSRPIDGKWIYVFRACAVDGRDAELHAELKLAGGRIRNVTAGAKAAGDDGGGTDAIVLELERPEGQLKRRLSYFFHLAPYRLVPSALAALREDIRARRRGISLADGFYVDVYPLGHPDQALPELALFARRRELPPEEKRGYRVHLPDALEEGGRRAHVYADALDAWSNHLQARAGDSEYVLAKRFQVLTRSAPNLKCLVEGELVGYLRPKETESAELHAAAERAERDLLRWIGREQTRGILDDLWNPPPTIIHAEHGETYGAFPPGAEAWSNPFSLSVNDYLDAPEDVAEEIDNLVAAVHERLDALGDGQAWLEKNLDRCLGKDCPLAHGGATLVFQAKRKTGQAVTQAHGLILATYGKAWARKYREEALTELKQWVRANYGIDLARLSGEERRSLKRTARRELKRARRLPIDELAFDPESVKGLRFSQGASAAFGLAVEAVNVAYAAQQIAKDPGDTWSYVEATGAILDAYDSISDLHKGLRTFEVKLTGRAVALQALKPITAVAGVIDIAGGARGMFQAREGGERFGFAMSTVGAAASLAGAFAVTGPVPLAILAIGLVLQAAGQGLAAQFDPLSRLLRNSRFANTRKTLGSAIKDGTLMGEIADAVDPDVDEPWYTGKLCALRRNISAQHRALDEILYGFEAKVVNDGSKLSLRLTLGVHGQITEGAVWQVALEVFKDPLLIPERRGAPLVPDHVIRLDTDAILQGQRGGREMLIPLLDVEPMAYRDANQVYRPARNVLVKGRVSLDVRGDGKTAIVRRVSAALGLNDREVRRANPW